MQMTAPRASPYAAAQQYGIVRVQPGQVQANVWMNVPRSIPGVPPGLEYLTMVDRIVVHQLLEWAEIVLNYETKNKYVLLNANGEQVYYAFEESSLWMRCWCETQRSFTIHIVDNFGNEVLRVTRPFKCCGGGCYGILAGVDCCSYECSVEAPPGNFIGSVVQRQDCCASSFDVKNEIDQIILSIDGPVIAFGRNVVFPVKTPSGAPVGDITKKWGGVFRELVTNADTFSVSFPINLDVKAKALLLGATFMIDFAEFEQQKNF